MIKKGGGRALENIKKMLEAPELNILITGDSIAYNRYGYYDEPCAEACCCAAGMPSWSFSLRDRLWQSDKQFVYADELSFDCRTRFGLDTENCDIYAPLFGGRVITLIPDTDISFELPVSGKRAVLCFQKRPKDFGSFDIYLDGELKIKAFNTSGDEAVFRGFEPKLVCLEGEDLPSHKIEIKNIKGDNAKITLCFASGKYFNITLNGVGGKCVSFFNESFKERVEKYSPNLIIISLSGNDRAYVNLEDYKAELKRFFSMIKSKHGDCGVLFLMPPSAADPENPQNNELPFTSDETAELYNAATEELSEQFGFDCMRISSLFEGESVDNWRFDNIHLNKNGNNKLLEAIVSRLGV